MVKIKIKNYSRSEDLYSVGSRTREIPILVSGQIYTRSVLGCGRAGGGLSPNSDQTTCLKQFFVR